MEHLYEKLREYAKGDAYPLHMPGHKRRAFGEMPPECYAMDVTEIDGFDDLHAPEAILKDLQERVARLYGAQESFCLVNGSTAGILSAISAAVPEGGCLLMARNCHKSAYHAAYLRKLQITYLLPEMMEGCGICDFIRPEQVRRALEADPGIAAVLIVSPTYEGRISPVREIAKVVHEFGKILIVDEAHGAHLGLVPDPGKDGTAPGPGGNKASGLKKDGTEAASALPWHENGCQAGADLVIHSVHKTLPAMTQTALLHVNGDRVDRERLRRFLRIYQSSSPSYVLMASIDNAVTMMQRRGEELYGKLREEFLKMTKALQTCRHFRFLGAGISKEQGEEKLLAMQDVGKLVILSGDSGMTGQQIYDVLRDKYQIQLEMAAEPYCLAMFTVGDAPEGYERLRDALLQMDGAISNGKTICQTLEKEKASEQGENLSQAPSDGEGRNPAPKAVMPLWAAWDAPWEEVPMAACEGRICAEFVNLYPPGTPIAAPGERLTREILERLLRSKEQGLRLRGVSKERGGSIRCVVQEIDGK